MTLAICSAPACFWAAAERVPVVPEITDRHVVAMTHAANREVGELPVNVSWRPSCHEAAGLNSKRSWMEGSNG